MSLVDFHMRTWFIGQSHGNRKLRKERVIWRPSLDEESIGRAGNLKRKEVKQFRLLNRERKGAPRERCRILDKWVAGHRSVG